MIAKNTQIDMDDIHRERQNKAVDEAVAALRERVAKGMDWLVAHDEAGNFHHWFEAGISPLAPMPAQTDEVRAAYREYHRQRSRWEGMSAALEKVDPQWRPAP